jgi:hypothetical protein
MQSPEDLQNAMHAFYLIQSQNILCCVLCRAMNKMPDDYDAENFGSKQYMDDWQALGVTIEDVGEFAEGGIEDKVGLGFRF